MQGSLSPKERREPLCKSPILPNRQCFLLKQSRFWSFPQDGHLVLGPFILYLLPPFGLPAPLWQLLPHPTFIEKESTKSSAAPSAFLGRPSLSPHLDSTPLLVMLRRKKKGLEWSTGPRSPQPLEQC